MYLIIMSNNQNNKNNNNDPQLPMKKPNMSDNTKKKKFELYKKGIILYRLTTIINILESMKKSTKSIQNEFRKEYSLLYQELKEIENSGDNIKNYGTLLGTIKNNFKKISNIDATHLVDLKNQNQLEIYKKLINSLNKKVKNIPPKITKVDQIQIKKYLGTLINNFYYIFNIDLSLKNNEFPLNKFYEITLGNKQNNSKIKNFNTSNNNLKNSNKVNSNHSNEITNKLKNLGLTNNQLKVANNMMKKGIDKNKLKEMGITNNQLKAANNIMKKGINKNKLKEMGITNNQLKAADNMMKKGINKNKLKEMGLSNNQLKAANNMMKKGINKNKLKEMGINLV